jgi:transposase
MTIGKDNILVKNIDHLGLISGMIEELGFVDLIDKHIANDSRKVSVGTAVKALIMNSMGFSQHALYISPSFFERCDVEHLFGSAYSAADFNDDSLGRALDRLSEYGVSRLFSLLSYTACQNQGLDDEFMHADSTNFSVEGEYKGSEGGGVSIAHGYPKDGRRDLKQVTLGLITAYQSSIPRYIQCFDGNSSDKDHLPTLVSNYVECFKGGEKVGIFISDSGIYSAENISDKLAGLEWITRVPETIGSARKLISDTAQADLSAVEGIDGYSIKAFEIEYGGVPQRWLLVYSNPLFKAATKTIEDKADKQMQQLRPKIQKWVKEFFKEQSQAEDFIRQISEKYPLLDIQFSLKEQPYYIKKGKPTVENQRIGYQFQSIELRLNTAEISKQASAKSRFILTTNVLDKVRLPDEKILKAYKQQASSVENSFKFLKDPIFFAESFFVKKTGRLQALLMIMALALLIYALCERKLRNALAAKKETVWSQNKQKTEKPTMRMVFSQFRGIHIVKVTQNGSQQTFIANLNENHRKIISILGHPFSKYYLLME